MFENDSKQIPVHIMKKAVQGIGYIGHPLRLRILEYLDVYGASSVSEITKHMNEEQVIISQSLRKMRDMNLVKSTRKGVFVYYDINEEYPASVFVCLRRLYGYMTDSFHFMKEDFKALLPSDYTMMSANRIKLFANWDKMRILEFLALNGRQCVSAISEGIQTNPLKVSQYLKRLKDDGFVICKKEGRFVHYEITNGIHKTIIGCIHRRYNSLKNKDEF